MLDAVNASSMDAFLESVIPANIRRQDKMALSPALSEHQILSELRSFADKNQVKTSLIGMGYYNCFTPPVIQRNILENPAWYTAYTPYQPEISQGRLEAILNFQTMVTDLTGMDIANGSLLDEATAAAEAMALANRTHKARGNRFLVDPDTHPQTISILRTRAEPLGIIIDVQPVGEAMKDDCFGGLLSYPSSSGMVRDLTDPHCCDSRRWRPCCCLCGSTCANPISATRRNGRRHCCWQRSVLACRLVLAVHTPHILLAVRPYNAQSPDGLLECRVTSNGNPLIVWPCKPASSIFAGKKRRQTSVQPKHYSQSLPVSMLSGMVQTDSKTLRHTAISKLDDLALL